MKAISTEYQESINNQWRNPSFIEITFGNIDTEAAGDGSWATNGQLPHSEVDTLDYDYDYGNTCATLELNRWALDGTSDILPDEAVNDGFISDLLSDEDGNFSTAAILTREFSSTHTLVGVTLSFDTRIDEWVRSVTVSYYSSDVVIATATVAVTSNKIVVDLLGDSVDKITVELGTGLPYRYPRVERALFGIEKTFENTEVVSTSQSHDVDPISRRVPNEKMSFTILDFEHEYDMDNPSGIWNYVDIHSPISIRHGYTLDSGKVEWLSPDRYILTSRPSVANHQATFDGTGLVQNLTGLYYKSTLGSKTLYDMANDLLLDANLTLSSSGENPWVIDESLKSMYTTAALPIDTYANCLQMIAHAACCKLYSDESNIIHIEPFSLDNLTRDDFTLDFDSITHQSLTASKIDELRAVEVHRYSYSAGESTVLYNESTTETSLHVEFSAMAQDVIITVSDGTVTSSAIYANAVDLVLSDGTKTVTITGTPLTQTSVAVTQEVNTTGEVDVEENPLITNTTTQAALLAHVAAYLSLRNTYSADYRGNPELETGDVIGLQTMFTDEIDTLVLTNELTFNGTLKGKVTVKAL